MKVSKGKLYLIPTVIGDEHSALNLIQLERISVFVVENLRSARRFLRAVGYKKNFDTECTFFELDKHKPSSTLNAVFDFAQKGENIGLMSEAGNPCVADPGNLIVMEAHRRGIEVFPLVGASSILLTLIASGLNGQQFCFHGYLPIEAAERRKRLKQFEQAVLSTAATQIFMETPYRNQKLFEEVIDSLLPQTLLCVSCDLLLPTQFIKTQTVGEWRKAKPELHKRLAMFAIGKP